MLFVVQKVGEYTDRQTENLITVTLLRLHGQGLITGYVIIQTLLQHSSLEEEIGAINTNIHLIRCLQRQFKHHCKIPVLTLMTTTI